MRARRPDQMWALAFQVDVTVDGRQVRFLSIIDEYTRDALATRAARSFTSDATVAMLDVASPHRASWPTTSATALAACSMRS
ncbi:hypothetical protein [Micromonospora sonneratiae]|uniref:Transposase n=1 Tax=Micromonospora sonneratiae TaxID=1184706 RepID=A0ABW3YC88_9ACTN